MFNKMFNKIFSKKSERVEPERHSEKRRKDRKIETWRASNPDPADMVDAVQKRAQNTDNSESRERRERRKQRELKRQREEQEQQKKETENQETEKRKREEADQTRKKQEREAGDQKFNDLMATYNIDYGTSTSRFAGIRQAVESLGCRTYSDWTQRSNLEKAPWRLEMVMRVKHLVAVAERRQSHGHRCVETTWSMMEQDIFKNFRYDSRCSTCHKRLWQPDILPKPIELHHRKRSEKSKADCYCDRERIKIRKSHRMHDTKSAEYSPGEGTGLIDSYESNRDRIFCLFPSNSLEGYRQRLLSTTSSEINVQRLLSELEKSQHNLFPFLVCVVDLSGDGDTYRTLRYRVAFSLHTAILSQYCLLQAADPAQEVLQPLAWCITYEGTSNSRCALFIACLRTATRSTRKGPDRPPIRIMQLWQGELTARNNSLQLLLLLDYIAEWAKAVYSKCVVQCLRLLVARADSKKRPAATILCTGITPSSSSVDSLLETEQGSDTGNMQDETEASYEVNNSEEEEDDDDESSWSVDSRMAELINDKTTTFHPSVLRRSRQMS